MSQANNMELLSLSYSRLGVSLELVDICIIACLFLLVYIITIITYSLTLHPLAKFPGPIWTASSRIPFWIACITGDQVRWMHNLHVKYGPVVRYSPNDLSFVDQDGAEWKAIHGHEKGGRELPKAREWFVEPANGIYGINSTPAHSDHRRFRKLFSPAFSERALKSNEPVLRKHVDLLIAKLGEAVSEHRPLDMVQMYQFTTFDFMGDLTFGQPLGLLRDLKYSRWVEVVFDSIKVIPVAQLIQYYPWLHSLFKTLEPRFVRDLKYNHFKYSADRVDWRLERGAGEQPDIWSMVLAAKGGEQVSLEEMYCHADVFMLAGSETTGSSLSGLTYHLLANPKKLAILTKEIRSLFKREEDITLQSTAQIEYLNACIQEGLRLYPPVPVGVPRVVGAAGQTIGDQWVAPGTRVSVHHYATYRSPQNFRDPDQFAPERWLSSSKVCSSSPYRNDRRESCQPFACGPRDCLGRNLAMHEMRYILARVLFRFDLELERESSGWDGQRAFVLWEKKALMCTLRAASRC
ncbi:cytochrome P450 [Apiospora marii]|uniref:Cytochrome P450 n=1 Tax=Apiospora marii TaxID=335849 RepID=A0ABR1RED1_9PEZI